MAKITAIQLRSTPSVNENITTIDKILAGLTFDKNHIVVLPECCLFFGGKDSEQLSLAKSTHLEQSLKAKLAELAKRYSVNLIAGSVPLYIPEANKFTNSCCVFSSTGECLTQYDKIHLFDVNVDDNEKNYCESFFTQAGEHVKTVDLSGLTIGLSICYDLRFPELFRQLRMMGAQIITVPSAFTKVTGNAHWQTLLRARAIENQVYIVAAGQEGVHKNGRETWGHSMIISPWGEILACKEHEQGAITVDICLNEINKIRKAIPVAEHNRFITKLK